MIGMQKEGEEWGEDGIGEQGAYASREGGVHATVQGGGYVTEEGGGYGTVRGGEDEGDEWGEGGTGEQGAYAAGEGGVHATVQGGGYEGEEGGENGTGEGGGYAAGEGGRYAVRGGKVYEEQEGGEFAAQSEGGYEAEEGGRVMAEGGEDGRARDPAEGDGALNAAVRQEAHEGGEDDAEDDDVERMLYPVRPVAEASRGSTMDESAEEAAAIMRGKAKRLQGNVGAMKQLLSNWRLETGAAKHGAEGGEKGEVGEQGGAEGEEGEAEDRMMERGKGVEGEAAAEQGGAEGEEGEAEDRMNKREKGVEGGASGVEGAAEIVERVNLAAGLEVEEGAKEWDEEEEGVPQEMHGGGGRERRGCAWSSLLLSYWVIFSPAVLTQPALCHLSTLASLPLTGYCTEEEGGRGGGPIANTGIGPPMAICRFELAPQVHSRPAFQMLQPQHAPAVANARPTVGRSGGQGQVPTAAPCNSGWQNAGETGTAPAPLLAHSLNTGRLGGASCAYSQGQNRVNPGAASASRPASSSPAHINGFPAASQRAAIPNASGARSGAAASHRSASFGGQPPPSMMPGGGVPVPIADAQTPHLGSPASVGHVPGGSSRNPPGSGNLARPGVSSGHGYGSCGGMHQPTPSPGHAAAYSGHSNHELGAIPNGIGGRISGGARAAASAPASPASMGRAPVAHGPSVSHPLNQSASAGSRRPLAAPRPGLGIPLNPGPRPVASVAEQAAMNKYATKGDLAALRTEFLQALQAHTCLCGASGSLGAAPHGGENNGGGAGAQYKPKPRTRSVVAIALDAVLAEQKDWRDTHRGGGRERVRNFLTRSYSHPFLSLCPYLPAIGRTRTEEEGGRGTRTEEEGGRGTRTEEEGRRGRGEMHRGVGKEAVVCVSLHAACIGFDSYPATPLILSSVSVLISLPLAGNAQRWREGEAEEMQRREGEAKVCVGLYIAPLCIALVSLTLLEIEQIKEMGGLRIHVDTEDTQLPFSSKAFAVGIRHAFTRTNVTLGAFKTRQIAYAVLVLECPLLEEEGRMTNNPEVNREKYESTVVKCRKWVELAVTTMGVRYDSRKNAFLFGNGVCIDASDYPASLKKNVTRAQMLQRLLSPSRDDTREQTLVHAAAVTVTTGTTAFDTCSIAAAGEGLQSLPSHVSACVAMLAALGARVLLNAPVAAAVTTADAPATPAVAPSAAQALATPLFVAAAPAAPSEAPPLQAAAMHRSYSTLYIPPPSHCFVPFTCLSEPFSPQNCNASLRSATTGANTCAVSRKRSWEQAVMPMQSRQGAEGAIDGQLITSEVSRKRSLSQDSSTGVEGVLDGQLKALLLEMEEEERRAVQAPLVE
ncbi:unnamed protein product [Closterium sp. NIES-64]|nr:unnamed protein product [Closterium sp. NIES-64]